MQGFLTLYGRAQSSLHTVLQHTKRIPSSNGAFGLLMRNKNRDSKSHGRENATFRPALQSWLKLVSFCNMNNCRVVQRSIPGENRAVRWLHDLVKAAVICMRSPWPFQKERTPGNGTSAHFASDPRSRHHPCTCCMQRYMAVHSRFLVCHLSSYATVSVPVG